MKLRLTNSGIAYHIKLCSAHRLFLSMAGRVVWQTEVLCRSLVMPYLPTKLCIHGVEPPHKVSMATSNISRNA